MKEKYQSFWGQNMTFEFGQKANGGVFYAEKMKTPNPAFDAVVYKNYQTQLSLRKSEVTNALSQAEKVKAMIKENLFAQHKDISQEEVATQLFITTKALQRSLEKENTSWNELKNELRADWVKENIWYQSNVELADFLSFSNINNFNRWFKTKFDMTPEMFRKSK